MSKYSPKKTENEAKKQLVENIFLFVSTGTVGVDNRRYPPPGRRIDGGLFFTSTNACENFTPNFGIIIREGAKNQK